MSKIKNRLESAMTQMQLALNEAERLTIMSKPISLDDDSKQMLTAIESAADKLRSNSTT